MLLPGLSARLSSSGVFVSFSSLHKIDLLLIKVVALNDRPPDLGRGVAPRYL